MDKIKNLIIMISGVGLCISIIYLINFISVEYFEYSIPDLVKFMLLIWLAQLINKVPPFKNSKIVLFEKKKNEKER